MPAAEKASILAELDPPYLLRRPREQMAPFVFCSPHSGRVYPTALLRRTRLDFSTLRKSEDCYVDELFQSVVDLGAPLIAARFPRAYLDVNREPYELDPELFAERLPPGANTQSVRVAAGLGTIARIVADGAEIYRERLPLSVAHERIERLYRPFHGALDALIGQTRERFGFAILVDCHSMPSASNNQVQGVRPHFVIGDRFGSACDGRLTRQIRDILGSSGYDVQLNRPYAGGFITEHYGRPVEGVHAVQIEINRALYLDEHRFEKTAGFTALATTLSRFAQRMFADVPLSPARRAAAE
jgi:N-formylglutamate amidohydrolase